MPRKNVIEADDGGEDPDDRRRAKNRIEIIVDANSAKRVREPSGDPVIDDLWGMKVTQVEKIASDESDPRHDKAQAVLEEMMRPLREAFRDSIAPMLSGIEADVAKWAKPISNMLAIQPVFPKLDVEMIGFSRPELDKLSNQILSRSIQRAHEPPVVIDFRSPAAPDASPVEVRDAAESSADAARDAELVFLRELVAQGAAKADHDRSQAAEAKKREKHLDARHRDSHKLAWSAALGGWSASVIGVVGIVVAVVIAMWPRS